MRTALAFLRRDFTIATSYRMAFALELGGIIAAVPYIFFMSRVLDGAQSPLLAPYGGNYFAFLLIGVAFIDYMSLSLKTFNNSIRESQLMGTLEIILLSPTALPKILIYSSLWGYLFTSVRFLLYLMMGKVFGLNLGNANFIAAFGVLAFAVVSFASFGILIASVTILIKKGEILNVFISSISVLLGGVIYPTSVLPDWLMELSRFLPITYALEGMRMALLGGHSTEQVLPYLAILAGFSVVLFPLGMFSFWGAVRWTKITGTLAQY